jgi:hypothetical protein
MTDELTAELKADVKKILLHVGGGYDENGKHYSGLSSRVERLEHLTNSVVAFVVAITIIVAATWFTHAAGWKA